MRYEPPQRIHYCHLSLSLSLSLSHSLLVSLRSSFYLRRNGSASFQFCKKNDTVFTIRVGLYSRSQIAGFTAQLAPKPLIYFIYNLYLYFFIPLLIFKCYVIEFFFFLFCEKVLGFSCSLNFQIVLLN